MCFRTERQIIGRVEYNLYKSIIPRYWMIETDERRRHTRHTRKPIISRPGTFRARKIRFISGNWRTVNFNNRRLDYNTNQRLRANIRSSLFYPAPPIYSFRSTAVCHFHNWFESPASVNLVLLTFHGKSTPRIFTFLNRFEQFI